MADERKIFSFHCVDFRQKLIRQKGNIWFSDSRGIKDIDYLPGNDGVIDNLADGGLNLFTRVSSALFIKLSEGP